MANSVHTPHYALFEGRDAGGNYLYTTKSGSRAGCWYHTVIFKDGSGGICDCPSYERRGTCTLTEEASALIEQVEREGLAYELLDLAAGIGFNIDWEASIDGSTYELSTGEARRLALLCG